MLMDTLLLQLYPQLLLVVTITTIKPNFLHPFILTQMEATLTMLTCPKTPLKAILTNITLHLMEMG